MFWSDDKELSSTVNVIGRNSFQKKKMSTFIQKNNRLFINQKTSILVDTRTGNKF